MSDNREITEILRKITYRLPWEDWDLTEHEYDLIGNVSGEQIVEIAYKNGLKISTLLKNADELIEEHNELQQRTLLREMRNLKMDLISSVPRVKKTRVHLPDSDEVERRLVQEAIEEVVAGASLTDPAQENLNGAQDSLDDIELMLERRGLKQGGFANENFANRIRRATASTQRTPDMDRDCDESFNKSLNVTIRDIHRTDPDLHNLNGSDPLPVATPDDLAALGMFTGQIGRPLMDKISSLRNPSLPQSSPLRKSARQISLPNVFTPEPIPDNFISDEFGETPVELPSIPHMEPNNVSGVQVTTPKLAPSAQAAQETIGPMHEVSSTRHEAFERIVSQIEKQAQEQSRTPRRRRQRRAIREQRGIDAGEILEFNKPLIWHKIKKKATKTRKPEAQLRLILDIYEDLGEYEQDAIDLLDTEEPPPIEIPALQPIKESQFNIPTVLETTKPSVKRSRMSEDKENDAPAQVSMIEPSAQFDGTPFFVPKMSLPSRISALRDQMNPNRHFQTPIVDFVPQHTSTAGRKTRPPFQLTLEDMEEARLNYISEQPRLTGLSNFGAEQNDGDKLGELPSFVDVPQNIVVGDKSSAAAPTKTAGDRAQPEEHFRKVVKDGETMIEYVGVNGTVERQSEYCLETIALYLQIRFLMKQNGAWKMKYNDLKEKLQLLKEVKDRVIEMRLILLADEGYLKLTYLDEDEKHIDDVEIVVGETMEVE